MVILNFAEFLVTPFFSFIVQSFFSSRCLPTDIQRVGIMMAQRYWKGFSAGGTSKKRISEVGWHVYPSHSLDTLSASSNRLVCHSLLQYSHGNLSRCSWIHHRRPGPYYQCFFDCSRSNHLVVSFTAFHIKRSFFFRYGLMTPFIALYFNKLWQREILRLLTSFGCGIFARWLSSKGVAPENKRTILHVRRTF